HWAPDSEPFTGADALLTALLDGWEMNNRIRKETHWYAGMRFVTVYHFELAREGETRTMPVIHNPYVEKLVTESEVELEEIEMRD
ncbi:MAG TPA: hypothetical protein VHL11_01655, partial [Phototrophicaceae bacterium]|nr:hypothetical protein [Phototrophicaceae bacterium]